MTDELTAYMDGVRIGRFARAPRGMIELTFDDAWRSTSRRMELSLSLPKSRRVHTGTAPENYLWNLLPDNAAVLQRWATKFGVSSRDPMALLTHVGLDTAGAVQLSTEDSARLAPGGQLDPIDVAEIAAHIRHLRTDPEAWLLPGHASGYFFSPAHRRSLHPPDGAIPDGPCPRGGQRRHTSSSRESAVCHTAI